MHVLKVAIIGMGSIGAEVHSQISKHFTEKFKPRERFELKISVINRSTDKAQSKGDDNSGQSVHVVNHHNFKIKYKYNASPSHLRSADIICFTAGLTTLTSKSTSRKGNLPGNLQIIDHYAKYIKQYANKNALICISSNPPEALAYFMQQQTEFPPGQILAMGSELDSMRFIRELHKEVKSFSPDLAIHEIDVICLGIHAKGKMFFPKEHIKIKGESIKTHAIRNHFETRLDDILRRCHNLVMKEGTDYAKTNRMTANKMHATMIVDIIHAYLHDGDVFTDYSFPRSRSPRFSVGLPLDENFRYAPESKQARWGGTPVIIDNGTVIPLNFSISDETKKDLKKVIDENEKSILKSIRAYEINKYTKSLVSRHTFYQVSNEFKEFFVISRKAYIAGFYDEALSIIEDHLYGCNKKSLLQAHLDRGMIYEVKGEFKKALEAYKDAAPLWKELHNTEQHKSLHILLDRACEEIDPKHSISTTCLPIRKKISTHFSRDPARIFNNLGNISSDSALKKKLFNAVRKLTQEDTKSSQLYRSFAYDNQAITLIRSKQDTLIDAHNLSRQSLKILRSYYNDPHPMIAASMNNLGNIYFVAKKYREAIKCYEYDAKSLIHTVTNPHHPDLGICYYNAGVAYQAQHNKATAHAYFVTAKEIFAKSDMPLFEKLSAKRDADLGYEEDMTIYRKACL